MPDNAQTAALLFLDSLGTTLPFQKQFNYKQVQDFLRREGFMFDGEMSDDELVSIGDTIRHLSAGHVSVEARPLKAGNRTPISTTDVKIAGRVIFSKCRSCGEPCGERLLCASCHTQMEKVADVEPEPAGLPRIEVPELDIRLGAEVFTHNGTRLHVVETDGMVHIGMDDAFETHTFTNRDVQEHHNMDDPVGIDCPTCGETIFKNQCPVCGYDTEQ